MDLSLDRCIRTSLTAVRRRHIRGDVKAFGLAKQIGDGDHEQCEEAQQEADGAPRRDDERRIGSRPSPAGTESDERPDRAEEPR